MDYQLVRWRKYGHDRVYIQLGELRLGHLDLASGRLVIDGADDPEGIVSALTAAGYRPNGLEPHPDAASNVSDDAPSSPVDAASSDVHRGRAGASLQAEADRRRRAREQKVRAAHPRLGGLLLKVTKEPVQTRNLEQGAIGERRVAAKLEGLAGPDVIFRLL